jgi:hypothetical protein
MSMAAPPIRQPRARIRFITFSYNPISIVVIQDVAGNSGTTNIAVFWPLADGTPGL